MDDFDDQSWKKFLDPNQLKPNLMLAALFILVFEFLKSSIVDRAMGFFAEEFNKTGPVENQTFRDEILVLDKSPVRATLIWLKNLGAIDDTDIDVFQRALNHRNSIAHELLRFVTESRSDIDIVLFQALLSLFEKIERWWIMEVEVPCNPDLDGQTVNPQEVHSLRVELIKLMTSLALDLVEEPKAFLRGLA